MAVYKSWRKLCKGYFAPEELLSTDGMRLFDRGHMTLNWCALTKLVAFREHLDVGFKVNHGSSKRRGWRSCKENLLWPCTGRPYHPMGVAFDVTPIGMDLIEFAAEAEIFGFHGVGLYNTFCHIDMRPVFGEKRFRWDNRKNK